ncbi:hypothetical protein R3P38DRAFT_325834 [Favolaschia claudopus]|uniref:Uncharacterized protein n=1 Tax=Favolaschia claudopus TaxID=2862362 RepID=A0AAW0CW97_9AGAR
MSTPTQAPLQLPPTGTPIPGVPPILVRIANIPLVAFPINHTLALLGSKPITASALNTTVDVCLTVLMGKDLLERPVKPLLKRIGGMVDHGYDIVEGIFVFPLQTTPEQIFEKFRPLDKYLTPLVNALNKIATIVLMIPPVLDKPGMYQIQRLFMILKNIVAKIGLFLNSIPFLRNLAHSLTALTSLYTTAFEGFNNTIQATAGQFQTHIADASANVQKELDKGVAAWEKQVKGAADGVSDWAGNVQDRLRAANAAAEGNVPNPMQGLDVPKIPTPPLSIPTPQIPPTLTPKIPTPPIVQDPPVGSGSGASANGTGNNGGGSAANGGGGGGGSGSGLFNPFDRLEKAAENTAAAAQQARNQALGSLTPPKFP